MNPAPEAPGCPQDATAALRRQLILAQVQLMELEDTRDDLRTRLAEAQSLLAAAQRQADTALREHDAIARRLEALQQEEHGARTALATATNRIQDLVTSLAERQQAADQALRARLQLEQQHQSLLAEAAGLRNQLGEHDTRIAQLEAERRALRASWSWRGTAPLRALGRLLHRGGRPE